MATRNCEACGAKMSRQAGRCPHCGAMQSVAPEIFDGRTEIDDRLEARKQDPVAYTGSAEDARAILRTTQFDDGTSDTVSGLLRHAWRAQTPKPLRYLEELLTAVAFPMVLVGVLWVWWVRMTRVENFTSVSIGRVSSAVATGCVALYFFLTADSTAGQWVYGGMGTAWIVRGVLRLLASPREDF
ncbi:MAG: hypothetical protein RMA76_08420 [Deltaproteobacteria bacterium]|jgi:hypothetical protein